MDPATELSPLSGLRLRQLQLLRPLFDDEQPPGEPHSLLSLTIGEIS